MRAFKNWSLSCIIAGSLLGGSCSLLGIGKAGPETVELQVTPSQPAAQGSVKVGADKDGNRTIDVRVEHLAPPERATPGARAYVLWVVPRAGGVPQNMGVLTLDDHLRGALKTTTSYRAFDILVTAEETPGATRPTGANVMRASVS